MDGLLLFNGHRLHCNEPIVHASTTTTPLCVLAAAGAPSPAALAVVQKAVRDDPTRGSNCCQTTAKQVGGWVDGWAAAFDALPQD